MIYSASRIRDRELLLLIGYRLPLALTGSGIVLGALATKGQTKTVANASLTSDVHEAFDVHLDFGTKLTFHTDARDDLADFGDFVVAPILDALVFSDSSLRENVRGTGASYAVDISQGNHSSFVPGDIDTGDTGHGECVLAPRINLDAA